MILNVIEAGEGPPVVLLHGLFGAGRNLAAVQRALAPRRRVLALDLRNHGDSPHAAAMGYAAMAADIAATLAARAALPAAIIGHSMGGKAAMALALTAPETVTRLLVSDIAPVDYAHGLDAYAAAMQALPLSPGLTRRTADTALAETIPEPGIRAFLLQNLRFDRTPPEWRLGLDTIARCMPEIAAFPAFDTSYDGPALFVAGSRSHYIRPEHRAPIRALFPAARFATVKDAGHWIHADNPAGFLAVVEGFLAA